MAVPATADLPHWVKWLAQDADGAWWGYEVEPLQQHRGWYENEVGRRRRVAEAPANPQWARSLLKVR